MPNETCKCEAIIDNSRCNVAMKHIVMCVEQEITVNCNGYIFRETRNLKDSHEPGAGANDSTKHVRKIEVELGKIKFDAHGERKKKGVIKKVSEEDQFMMS